LTLFSLLIKPFRPGYLGDFGTFICIKRTSKVPPMQPDDGLGRGALAAIRDWLNVARRCHSVRAI
jgi:hypothetical protein